MKRTPDFPGGPQFGARWNHIGARRNIRSPFTTATIICRCIAWSLDFALLRADVQRFYPQMRMYGARCGHTGWAR